MAEHLIDWTRENLFWGYIDATMPPVLTIASGDEVVLNCLPVRIPRHPVSCSDNIRSVIPEYPVT